MTKIYQAKSIITMNPSQPRATHMAVRDGHILAVGDESHLAQWQASWGEMEMDQSFAAQTLMPGFIEGHSHMMEGLFWEYAYVGYYDREGPDGTIHAGLKSIDDVVTRLREIDAARADKTAPLIAWGFDPIFFEGRRMSKSDLDQVS